MSCARQRCQLPQQHGAECGLQPGVRPGEDQPRGGKAAGLRRAQKRPSRNAPSYESPTAKPSTSRWPSAATPVVIHRLDTTRRLTGALQ